MNSLSFEIPLGLNTSKETAKFQDPVPVAVTDKVQFRNWNEPLQGHLALTRDPTEMMYVHVHTLQDIYLREWPLLCSCVMEKSMCIRTYIIASFPGLRPAFVAQGGDITNT